MVVALCLFSLPHSLPAAGANNNQATKASATEKKASTKKKARKPAPSDLNTTPFVPANVCTVDGLKPEPEESRAAIKTILLDLPEQLPNTACVDSREFAKDIRDRVHFDTVTQEKHGELFAEEYLGMAER